MNKNVGQIDKIARIILGLVILLIGLLYGSWLGLIGLVPLLTAVINWCPAYTLFGISTCKTEQKK